MGQKSPDDAARDPLVMSGGAATRQAVSRRALLLTALAVLLPAGGAVAADGSSEVVTVFSDDFEGGVGNWRIDLGTTTWGVSTHRASGGSKSAWCAAGGSAPQPAGGPYAPNMTAWLIYGPFSLADATAAWMEFDAWYETESGADEIWWGFSIDDAAYYGFPFSGASPWSHRRFDFADIEVVAAVCQPQVWVTFYFGSNASTELEGAYIDNVVIRKEVPIPGGCDLVLHCQSITTTVVHESCGTITAGPGLALDSPGDLTLRAATGVVLRNGFSIGSGARLTAAIDPSLAGT